MKENSASTLRDLLLWQVNRRIREAELRQIEQEAKQAQERAATEA